MRKKVQKESKIRARINEIYEENELANLEASRNRARSFSVGTAFGGIVEVSMRGDFNNLYCLLQPVEAVEFIEQLAAAAGLQVALRPRQDFATWRGWDVDAEDRYWVGAARWQLGNVSNKELEGSKEPMQLQESNNNESSENINEEEKIEK
jgi:hypothetical protein